MTFVTLFIFGLLSAIAALLLELLATSFAIDAPTLLSQTAFVPSTSLLFILAIIEEGSKILFLLQAKKRSFLHSPLMGGIGFGLGFASLEYFTLSFLVTLPGGPFYGMLLIHLVTSLILSSIITKTSSKQVFFLVFLSLSVIHFLYNSLL